MDNATLGTVLMVAAGAIFVLYFLRRRARKTKSFR